MTRKQRQKQNDQKPQRIEPPVTLKPRKPRLKQVKFEPMNIRQGDYADDIMDFNVVFGTGPAGTGKTYVALSCAADMLSRKEIDQIIITRPNISTAEKSLGFFKGTKQDKIAEWMRPALSILKKHFGGEAVNAMLELEMIRLEPLETMRGETFDNAFVLLDEAQNVTFEDMEMFLTRIGEGSTVVVDGDVEQTDLKGKSGLARVLAMVANRNHVKTSANSFPIHNFTVEDIVRSGITKEFVLMFRKEKGLL